MKGQNIKETIRFCKIKLDAVRDILWDAEFAIPDSENEFNIILEAFDEVRTVKNRLESALTELKFKLEGK